MKKFFVIMSAVAGLTSCTKQLSAPQGAAGQSLFFQNANVAVENMAAKPTAANTVDINFTTVFQNNISRIELMSGTTANNFCTAQSADVYVAHPACGATDINEVADQLSFSINLGDSCA